MPCMLFNSFAESVPLLLCLLPPWDGLSEQSHFWWGGCHLLYSICFLVWCGSSRALTVLSISLATNMNRPSSRILWAMYWCLDFTRPCFAYNESPYLQIRESFLMWNDTSSCRMLLMIVWHPSEEADIGNRHAAQLCTLPRVLFVSLFTHGFLVLHEDWCLHRSFFLNILKQYGQG